MVAIQAVAADGFGVLVEILESGFFDTKLQIFPPKQDPEIVQQLSQESGAKSTHTHSHKHTHTHSLCCHHFRGHYVDLHSFPRRPTKNPRPHPSLHPKM